MANQSIGKWAFIIGLIIAVIAGVIQAVSPVDFLEYIPLILVILGLIVGFLNIVEKDVIKLLVAIIAIMGVGTMTLMEIPAIGEGLDMILANFVYFAGAVGLVVAVKAILQTSKA